MKLLRKHSTGPEDMRQRALAETPHPVSRELLQSFPDLDYHPGTSRNTDTHYQDREIRGAVCCTPSEASLMHQVAKLCNPDHALEIGSYIGWSSAHIATGLPRGTLTCVDPFMETGTGSNGSPEAAARAHARFLSNMKQAGIEQRIRLVQAASPDVLADISSEHSWDFAFVDGWHLEGQPLRDVKGLLPFLADNAVLMLHDLWIADVRDALLHLIRKGWSYCMLDTANYLTLAWRGTEPDWMQKFRQLAKQPEYVLPDAMGNRLLYGLLDSSIEQAVSE